jgi:hypothetical protein
MEAVHAQELFLDLLDAVLTKEIDEAFRWSEENEHLQPRRG